MHIIGPEKPSRLNLKQDGIKFFKIGQLPRDAPLIGPSGAKPQPHLESAAESATTFDPQSFCTSFLGRQIPDLNPI
jgi:hypothetical protein